MFLSMKSGTWETHFGLRTYVQKCLVWSLNAGSLTRLAWKDEVLVLSSLLLNFTVLNMKLRGIKIDLEEPIYTWIENKNETRYRNFFLHLIKNWHQTTARKNRVFTWDDRNVISHAICSHHCFRTVSNNKTTIKTAVKLTARNVGAFQVEQTTPGLLETVLKFWINFDKTRHIGLHD